MQTEKKIQDFWEEPGTFWSKYYYQLYKVDFFQHQHQVDPIFTNWKKFVFAGRINKNKILFKLIKYLIFNK